MIPSAGPHLLITLVPRLPTPSGQRQTCPAHLYASSGHCPTVASATAFLSLYANGANGVGSHNFRISEVRSRGWQRKAKPSECVNIFRRKQVVIAYRVSHHNNSITLPCQAAVRLPGGKYMVG